MWQRAHGTLRLDDFNQHGQHVVHEVHQPDGSLLGLRSGLQSSGIQHSQRENASGGPRGHLGQSTHLPNCAKSNAL